MVIVVGTTSIAAEVVAALVVPSRRVAVPEVVLCNSTSRRDPIGIGLVNDLL